MNRSNGTHQDDQSHLSATHVLVLGFYDGITDGVIKLASSGAEFRLKRVDEDLPVSPANPFRLRRIQKGTVDRIAETLSPYHSPQWPVWHPNWTFPSDSIRDGLDQRIESLMSPIDDEEYELETTDPIGFSSFSIKSHQELTTI